MKTMPISKPSKVHKLAKAKIRTSKLSEPECPYNADDAAAVANFWAKGSLRMPGQRGPQKKPTKVAVTLRYSPEVLAYFKAQGDGWQTRINNVLLAHILKR